MPVQQKLTGITFLAFLLAGLFYVRIKLGGLPCSVFRHTLL